MAGGLIVIGHEIGENPHIYRICGECGTQNHKDRRTCHYCNTDNTNFRTLSIDDIIKYQNTYPTYTFRV